MPKSFLVKKKIKSRVCSSDSEDENVLGEQKQERNALKSKGKSLLWKPYAKEGDREINKGKGAVNAWSNYTPAGRGPETIEMPKPIQADALTHVDDRQLGWQNVKLPPFVSTSTDSRSNPETKHECSRCERTYTSSAALAKHQRYYCNFYQTKSFTCKYCDKVYLSLGALKMHIRTHTLPCTCMICGKAFSRPWLLQGHVRTHTGEKPYECTNCNRAFADRSNLRAHLQTHSQVKKYKCEQCSKTFSRMSLLIKHQTSTTCSME